MSPIVTPWSLRRSRSWQQRPIDDRSTSCVEKLRASAVPLATRCLNQDLLLGAGLRVNSSRDTSPGLAVGGGGGLVTGELGFPNSILEINPLFFVTSETAEVGLEALEKRPHLDVTC